MRVTPGQRAYGHGKCSKCLHVLSLDSFRAWPVGDATFRSTRCITCEGGQPELDRVKRPKLGAQVPSYYKKKELINSAKKKPCADCGKRFPSVCMDFDHRPGCGKSMNLSQMGNARLELIVAEIAKCDVVCSNCHRIRTAKRGHPGGRKRVVIPPSSDDSTALCQPRRSG